MSGPRDPVTPFWAALSGPDREELRRIGLRRFFRAGATILRQDEQSDHVIIVLAGCVKVCYSTGDGYQTVLALRDAGELLGELASMDGGPRSATLTALTEVEALLVTAARFEVFRRGRPAIDRVVQRLISARLRESDRSLGTVGAGSADHRLAQTLLSLGKRYGTPEGGGIRINLPLGQDDLAGLTSTSRRTVGRVLAEWRESGWISTGRRSMLLRDPGALATVQAS
jgi:CRP-like cAMP-binding protein